MTHLYIKGVAASALVAFIFTVNLCAQSSFVYTNNSVPGGNTVSGFSVAANGALTQIAGSPFATGGSGTFSGLFAANRITTCIVGDLLYASNSGTNNVSGFAINALTGFLTPVPGSPFATGGSSGEGLSLACTPDGRFLMAGHEGSSNIAVFSISANGSLSPISGSPFSAGGQVAAMKVTPDGRFLCATLRFSSVVTFNIDPNGALTPAGSLFTGGATRGVDVNCASTLLFGGDASFRTTVHVLSISSNGALSEIPGSPFLDIGNLSNVVVLSPDERFLFVSNQSSNSITVFNVAADGSLTVVPGSPFLVNAQEPAAMAINRAGTRLYVGTLGSGSRSISVFSIAGNGALSSVPGSPFATGQSGGLVAVTAFPAKSCAPLFDLCLQDESNGNMLQVSSRTGAYQLTNCQGFTIGGTGTVTTKGCLMTLQVNGADRRVLARIDTCMKIGIASVQVFSLGGTFTVMDRNTSNNTCSCVGG